MKTASFSCLAPLLVLAMPSAAFAEDDSLRLWVQGAHDVSDVYGGCVIAAGAIFVAPVGERQNLQFDLGASDASDDYAETCFSVTPAGATASGLPQFAAKGGLKDVGW
jgi:outer membrane scaffolding protein for murein synthesis (MipA/OmpV family)